VVYANLTLLKDSAELEDFDALLESHPEEPEPPPRSTGTKALMNVLGVGPPPPPPEAE
jgi:hypothetical protein